tara:strand:+ start:315 stop:2417 length:2103 start_codon:yes stop_codon:yes gene_type:complete
MKKFTIALSSLVLIVSSCLKDDYKWDNISLENYNPAVAAPIVNTRLTLHDLVKDYLESDSSILSIDADSLLWVTYSSNLFRMGLSDMFSISDQNINQSFTMDPFTISNINQSIGVTMGSVVSSFADPEKTQIQSADGSTAPFPPIPAQSGGEHPAGTFSGFTTVNFSQGTLTLTVTNNWPIDLVNLNIEIRNTVNNTLIGTVNYPNIAAGTAQSDAIDLTGQTMSNAIKANITNIESPGSGGIFNLVPIDLTDAININVATSSLVVSGGTAVFPSQQVLDDTLTVKMPLANGEILKTLRLKSGSIDYSINYGMKESANLTLSLPYLTLTGSGAPFNKVIPITSNNVTATVATGSFPLAGYEFDLTANNTDTNAIVAIIIADIVSSNTPVPFSSTDGVSADLTLSNLEIEFLDGDLGIQSFNLDADTVDFDFSELDFDATITLADPRIDLTITNSFGMELGADLSNISAINDQQTLALTGLGNITIGAPAYGNFGDSVKTTVSINTTTTNIDDILAINPSKLIFGMNGSTNPGVAPFNNFITDASYFAVGMDVQIPLYGGLSGFKLIDTLDFPTEAFKNVLVGNIKTEITNEFPLDVNVQAYFVDSNFMILDSLKSTPVQVLKSSVIDPANGDLVLATTFYEDIELTEAKVDNIKNATKIILVSEMATASGGANAKFYSKFGMDIKLGVYAKVKIDLNAND